MALDFVVKLSFIVYLIMIWMLILYMIFIIYKKNKIKVYLLFTLNILFLTIPTLSFLIFDYIDNYNNSTLSFYGNILGNFFSFASPLLFMFIYLYYSGKDLKIRHYLYIFLAGNGFGTYVIGQRWVYSVETKNWLIYSNVPVYILGLGIALILVENIFITSNNYKISKNKASHNELLALNLMVLSEILALLSLLVFVFEQDILNLYFSLYYLQFGVLSLVIKVFSLIIYPLAFVPLNINAKHLLIIDKQLGYSLFEYDFEESDEEKRMQSLSSALTVLQMVLKGISDSNSIPKEIRHINLVLTIEENEDRIIYFISERTFDIVNAFLKKIILIDNNPDIELYIHNKLQFLR